MNKCMALLLGTAFVMHTRCADQNKLLDEGSYNQVTEWVQNIIDAFDNDIMLYNSLAIDMRNAVATIDEQQHQFNDLVALVESGINNVYGDNESLHNFLATIESVHAEEISNLTELLQQLNDELAHIISAYASLVNMTEQEAQQLLTVFGSLQRTYTDLVSQRDLFLNAFNVVDQDINAYIDNANTQIRHLAQIVGMQSAVDAYDESLQDTRVSFIDGLVG